MSNRSCCVVMCKNTSRNSECKFYKFPVAKWKLNQRNKWIVAIKRKNVDGSPWYPKPHDYICSDHFMGGKKSEEEASPSYVPTIFPSCYKNRNVNESSALNRHKRFMERQIKNQLCPTTKTKPTVAEFIEINDAENRPVIFFQQKIDEECQVNFYSDFDVNSLTFICNRYVIDGICDAETQTEIVEDTRTIITNEKKTFDKECSIPHKTYNQETQTENKNFIEFKPIIKSEQLDSADVKFEILNFS